MSLPEIPDEVWAAMDDDVAVYEPRAVQAAWPHLYAAALRDFAGRLERLEEIAGCDD